MWHHIFDLRQFLKKLVKIKAKVINMNWLLAAVCDAAEYQYDAYQDLLLFNNSIDN